MQRRQAFQQWIEQQSDQQLLQLILDLASQLQQLNLLSDMDAQRVYWEFQEAGVLGGNPRAA
ncbi:MAG TPA: hypothetical protein VIU39_08350 [Anaerolineales bacterium]